MLENQTLNAGFRLEKTASTWTFVLARPKAKNALNEAVISGLEAVLDSAQIAFESEQRPRALILRGEGETFCAGGDVREMMNARSDKNPAEKITEQSARFGALCLKMREHPLIIIGVIDGPALGGGFGLACACDVLIASDKARFQLPETKIGLIPSQIAPYLVDRIGRRAMTLALTGRAVDAEEAYRIGLVDVLANAAELDDTLKALVTAMTERAPAATALTKRRFSREITASYAKEAASEFANAALGKEAAEGVSALLQKRNPSWAEAEQ